MLTTVIGIGVDFVIIFFTEIALPGLFAAIDLLLCVIDFLTPSGWNEQLKCVEEKCFRGPNIVADMLVFTHLPVVLHRFTAIMEATLNSRTGKRFFGTPGPGTFSAKSRTLDPDTGEPVERTETESAGMGNPMYEFDFADSFKELLPTMGAEQCGGCFNCKWPEIRLIWLLTASIGSLFSAQNVNEYRGNVTAHCLANGSWYTQACGPMGAELLPYRTWLKNGYTAGFVEIDARIFDSYAATIVKRSREMGASADGFFPELVQAARNWESVRSDADKILRTDFGDDDAEKAAPFVYHVCRNHRHEAKSRGLTYDMPHEFYNLASGSIERITGQFLWDQCRRWKFEIFSDFGRWAHHAVYNIQACTEDKVECKKEARRCFGSCSGVDGSEFNHDFATTVALTELSEFVLGDGFDSAAAANCTVKTYVFKIPTFAGGESFKTWAARLQTRSNAIAIQTNTHTHTHTCVKSISCLTGPWWLSRIPAFASLGALLSLRCGTILMAASPSIQPASSSSLAPTFLRRWEGQCSLTCLSSRHTHQPHNRIQGLPLCSAGGCSHHSCRTKTLESCAQCSKHFRSCGWSFLASAAIQNVVQCHCQQSRCTFPTCAGWSRRLATRRCGGQCGRTTPCECEDLECFSASSS